MSREICLSGLNMNLILTGRKGKRLWADRYARVTISCVLVYVSTCLRMYLFIYPLPPYELLHRHPRP